MALGLSLAASLPQGGTLGAWRWTQRVTQRSGEELPNKLSAKTRSQPSALRSLTVRRNTEEERRRQRRTRQRHADERDNGAAMTLARRLLLLRRPLAHQRRGLRERRRQRRRQPRQRRPRQHPRWEKSKLQRPRYRPHT